MEFLNKVVKTLKEVMFGMFYLDLYRDTTKYIRQYKDFTNLILLGEFIGLPILSTSITIKLLPYMYRDIIIWKIRQMREKDVTEDTPDLI